MIESEKIYVNAEKYWVFKVPEEVPPEVAVLSEPMAVSSRALERAYAPGIPTVGEGFGIGQSVVVQGAGAIGLLAVATAKIAGAGNIISVDIVITIKISLLAIRSWRALIGSGHASL